MHTCLGRVQGEQRFRNGKLQSHMAATAAAAAGQLCFAMLCVYVYVCVCHSDIIIINIDPAVHIAQARFSLGGTTRGIGLKIGARASEGKREK